MSLIKDIYSPAFYDGFARVLEIVLPVFDKKQFSKLIFVDAFKTMEWKERMKHTTTVFHEFLPADFPEAVVAIKKVVGKLRAENVGEDNLAFIFLPDYVETYGLEDIVTSAGAFEWLTQFISCEFAVRPFIAKYGNAMIERMLAWSLHESPKVRRLASEGSRPRLPWAMALPALKKDPTPILPILENLKQDPDPSVRRSVANNLNDITKDNPQLVLEMAVRWKGIGKETDAIVKHGCRTLLKQGHPEVLKEYGLEGGHVSLSGFTIETPEVKTGDSLSFSFAIRNEHTEPCVVRMEYGLYYKKANGQLSKKVFKISEKLLEPGASVNIGRKQSFKRITTRKFYSGTHQLSIILNGEEKQVLAFELLN